MIPPVTIGPMTDTPQVKVGDALCTALAKHFNNETWSLLERTDRSPEDDERLVHLAHASCYHWMLAGTPLNHQRGEWLIARVYIVLGHAESAIRHATRCMELTEAHRDLMKDFDFAYANEGCARANALAGNIDIAVKHKAEARKLGDAIADAEDKSIFDGDYDSGPWFSLA